MKSEKMSKDYATSMKISLVVATLGRTSELLALFSSFRIQACEIEVILVDQNADERLTPIVEKSADWFSLRHLRTGVSNSSIARNLGLRECAGDIVAFPDDDCVYPPGLLAQVSEVFSRRPDLAVLTGPAITEDGRLGSGRWSPEAGAITSRNVWTRVIEFNLFARTRVLRNVAGFDETLGIGAPFGSSEGPDLVLRVMREGGMAHYDTSLRIVHPDKSRTAQARGRAFDYGRGMGHVLRKNASAAPVVANFLVRPCGGILLSAVRMDPASAEYYWNTLRGRVSGFLARSSRKPSPAVS